LSEQNALATITLCTAPEVGRLASAYSFGRATEAERQSFERHLTECTACQQESEKLRAALRLLENDKGLLQTLTPADIASSFGISSRLDEWWGGHRWHVLLSSGIYAAIFAVTMLVEVAYQFDVYGRQGVTGATLMWLWMVATSLAALTLDWRLVRAGDRRALPLAVGVFSLGVFGAIMISRGFLPDHPVTLLTTSQAAPAQAAYLKSILYGLILNVLFWLPPFHFVITLQRELAEGRHRMTLGLLTGDKLSVTPRGAFYPRLVALLVCFVLVIVVAFNLHHDLMGKLKPDPYFNLFSWLIYARLTCYFALGAEGVAWYARSLNELKRECLAAERVWVK
jgi:hypothetical protein